MASSNGGEANINLLSEEQLDGRLSPELWPETIPGVTAFASLVPPMHSRSLQPKWALDEEGVVMLQELGSLTASALLEKVKDLQNLAYKLGIEESREMTRGRFLDVLRKDEGQQRRGRVGKPSQS
ncbi:protein lin-52 homolog [Ixodes scapularis]|uniref:Putative retinal tissue protein n=1 Tax=Ixodes ricinus TaxID=34613 RepID=A0A0K8RJZ5_IXORI|nr:protein lin-52 homolog [Ixodes scapularis]